MKLFITGFLTAILLLIGAGIALLYSGAFNVAADEDDSRIESWLLGTGMAGSVQVRARSITPPKGYYEEHQVGHGFRLYDEMCVQCHGAPGKKPGEVGLGLGPEPPDLSRVIRRWNAAELFWILKHGIKATGMPAFGKTHTDEQLWSLVAFVQRLPELSAEQYKALDESAPHDHGHEHQHEH